MLGVGKEYRNLPEEACSMVQTGQGRYLWRAAHDGIRVGCTLFLGVTTDGDGNAWKGWDKLSSIMREIVECQSGTKNVVGVERVTEIDTCKVRRAEKWYFLEYLMNITRIVLDPLTAIE